MKFHEFFFLLLINSYSNLWWYVYDYSVLHEPCGNISLIIIIMIMILVLFLRRVAWYDHIGWCSIISMFVSNPYDILCRRSTKRETWWHCKSKERSCRADWSAHTTNSYEIKEQTKMLTYRKNISSYREIIYIYIYY